MSKKSRYWIAENGIPLQNRNPAEGGVDKDRLELLVRDVFGKNTPPNLSVLKLSDDGTSWVDQGLLEVFTEQTS